MTNANLYIVMKPNLDALKQAKNLAATITNNKERYSPITEKTGVPEWFIGLIHMQECSFNFKQHLHNGDSLTARTVQVPKGRPLFGSPPFTFTESAIDALTYQGFAKNKDWSVGHALDLLEQYNGMGYRKHGINSPYLWAGSDLYTKGKYVKDGMFDANAVSKQIGVALVLKCLGIS